MSKQRTERAHLGPAPHLRRKDPGRGEFTLNGAFELLLVMALLVLAITVLGVVNQSMKLQSVATELVRYIELRGRVDAPVYTELDRLATAVGIEIDSYEIDATYTSGTKIQFGAPFSVTLHSSGSFGIGGILSVPVPLSRTITGRSEQYWK